MKTILEKALKDISESIGRAPQVALLGFGATLAKGTAEKISTEGWSGILTGPLCAGSGGIMAAVLAGLIMSLITKPKAK